jgi:hypothetical protein
VGKLPEAYHDRHAAKDGASRVPLCDEPRDIALQRFCDPRGSETIDRVGTDKVTFQHNNLHSVKGWMEVIIYRNYSLYLLSLLF